MKLTKFQAAIAIGSLLAAGSTLAQAQKGESETKSPPSQSNAPKSGASQQGQSSRSSQGAQSSQQGQNRAAERGNNGQGAARSEQKRQMGSENGQSKSNRTERRDNNGNNGSARSQARSKSEEKSKQAETNRTRDQNRNTGKAASKDTTRDGRVNGNDRKTTTNGKAQPSRDNKTASDANRQNRQGQSTKQGDRNRTATDQNTNRQGTTERVQLSTEQRTQAKQTILKSSNVNRARQASFKVNVGVRVPRSVRLAAIPAAVISIVPQYRSYRYVVVDDRICIVDPGSYTVVEVLDEGSIPSSGTQEARLVLTPEEEDFVLQSVEMGGSTLGLGAITIGSPVPRNARMIVFPAPIVERIGKLRRYEYVAADNRVAIVEPQSRDVVYVIERRR